MSFWEEVDQPRHGSSLCKDIASPTAQEKLVSINTIDDEVRQLGYIYVDFLKIDAEGYDFKVLEG